MKKILIAMSLLALVALPAVSYAKQRTKEESAKFLQELMRKQLQSAAQEQIEDAALRIDPKSVKLYKKVAGVISNSELAASICWDLIQLGLQTDKKQFATQFAMRLRKYLPEEYKLGAEAFNPKLEKWLGHRIPNEADCTTILYELGKNTYDAITRMSASEKQEARESGASLENPAAFFIGINKGNAYRNVIEGGSYLRRNK